MMGDSKTVLLAMLVASITGLIWGGLMGNSLATDHYRQQAIDHGYAAYDAQTGEWGWLDNPCGEGAEEGVSDGR